MTLITVWPCGHGNPRFEHILVPLAVTCNICGGHPQHREKKADETAQTTAHADPEKPS